MLSVIISTYNQPAWLELALRGYAAQTFTDFEVVVADDGSGPDTRALLDRLRASLPFPLRHVWHEDDGFRKTIILNRALTASVGDYLVFTDGDCIPRADFLAQHATLRRPGHFLSGGYYKLPAGLSAAITPADVASQRCFDLAWLRARGLPRTIKNLKLSARGRTADLLNRLTPTRATWNGMNASGWRTDLVAANGFDERMQYGGEDRELGERLRNAGLRARQIRYRAVCLHLHHGRGYVTPDMLARNAAIRAATRREGRVRTAFGLDRSE